MNTEIIKVARKAAAHYKNSDGYAQAAEIITMLCDELEKTQRPVAPPTHKDVLYDADGNELIGLDRLRELADAEREGRVVVLPDCKINDNVFVKVGNGSEVSEIAVDCFYVDELGAYIGHFDIDGQLMRWKDFTKC